MIHSFQLNGYNIVLDIAGGSVHSVDEPTYKIINLYKQLDEAAITAQICGQYPEISPAEVSECLNEIRELEAAGKLFSPDPYADNPPQLAPSKPVIKALCLHVAHTCNLTCDYCFAAQGKFHGERAIMSFEVGKQALDFLVANSGTRCNLEVDFFGGEPLCNWQVVKQLVAYARSIEKQNGKNFRFTLTTNGILLTDEVTEFANREMNNVVLSLDGRREVNDLFRRTPEGRGSYDIIVPKFQKFVAARGDQEYYLRGTYTHNNTDFFNDILQMLELGFDRLSLEPVVCQPDDLYALTAEDLPVLFANYELLAKKMLERRRAGRPFIFYHYMLDLDHGPCIYKRLAGCGTGVEYLAVTPTGELYPCHQFVGNPQYKMGDLQTGVTNIKLRERFLNCNTYAHEECRSCWARLYCSGGCAANAYKATGDIKGIYQYGCELFKKRLECALMLKVAEFEDNESKLGSAE